jgi:O-antigen/teichoic acid export membrane protein
MKSIKKNLLYNILLNVLSVISPLITAPYVARVLEPDGVGLLNFSGTYAGYFALVASLGIPTYGVREVAKFRDDKEKLSKVVSQLMSIALITTLLVTVVFLLSIALVDQLTDNYMVFLVSGFALYLSPIKVNWFFQGIEEFGYITLRTLITSIIGLICLFVFVREKNDLIILIIIGLAGGLIADIWNFVKMWNSGIRVRFTIDGLGSHMKPLLILFASSIAISIYTILDTIMLGFISDYNEVGYYNYAVRLSKMLLMLVTSLSIVAVPRISYYMEQKEFGRINELVNKSFSFVSFLAFPVTIGLMCISSTFVPLFLGEKYVEAVVPLMILSLLIIAIGLNNLTGVQILIGMGYDKLFLYSVITGTITNFSLNCFMIPYFGAIGASVSSVLAEFLILFVTTFYVYKSTPIRINIRMDMLKSLLGSLLFVPLFLLLHFWLSGWLLVVGYAFACVFVYLLFESLLKNSSYNLLYITAIGYFRKNEKNN